MEYFLLWLILGLIGYMLLAYEDIIRIITKPIRLKEQYTKSEYVLGMVFALVLGPLTIIWFIIKGKN